MAGLFENLLNRGATPMLEATWSFSLARHRVIAENVANMATPNYKAKRLDLHDFQRSLAKAMKQRGKDVNKPFVIEGHGEVQTAADGSLKVKPSQTPGDNVLFHDGTNMSIEKEMSDLASNAMLHEVTTTMLKGRMDGLRKAISGRV